MHNMIAFAHATNGVCSTSGPAMLQEVVSVLILNHGWQGLYLTNTQDACLPPEAVNTPYSDLRHLVTTLQQWQIVQQPLPIGTVGSARGRCGRRRCLRVSGADP